VTRMNDLTNGELRELLRQHTLIAAPGELLVVMVPPDWTPWQVRELSDALNAITSDPWFGFGPPPDEPPACGCPHPQPWDGPITRVLVVPGTAITIARMPEDPFADL
jgi:hypothetical protein